MTIREIQYCKSQSDLIPIKEIARRLQKPYSTVLSAMKAHDCMPEKETLKIRSRKNLLKGGKAFGAKNSLPEGSVTYRNKRGKSIPFVKVGSKWKPLNVHVWERTTLRKLPIGYTVTMKPGITDSIENCTFENLLCVSKKSLNKT